MIETAIQTFPHLLSTKSCARRLQKYHNIVLSYGFHLTKVFIPAAADR